MLGVDRFILKDAESQLAERAFSWIEIIVQGQAVTVMDEPFVSKSVEHYFVAMDRHFKEVRKRMVKSTAFETDAYLGVS